MSTLFFLANQYISRLVFGFIFACLIAMPSINGSTDSKAWTGAAVLFFATVIVSVIWKFRFNQKNKWALFSILAALLAVGVYEFFQFYRVAAF